jgi:putative membrane protein
VITLNILIAIVLNAIALLITAYIVPGFHVDSFTSALIAAIVIGVINAFIRPILAFISAPITLLTLGLFSFVINAACLYLATLVVPGFSLDGFLAAVLGGIVLAIVATVIDSLTKTIKKSF